MSFASPIDLVSYPSLPSGSRPRDGPTAPLLSEDAVGAVDTGISSAVSSPSGGRRKRLTAEPQPTPSPAKRGRRKDPVWDDIVVADEIVSCKKCEKIIHYLGATHVDRVRDHFKRKCAKRPVTKPITSCFQPALVPSRLMAFQRQFALWFYSSGMAFNKIKHETLAQALTILNPGVVLPTALELATTLLDGSYGELKLVIVRRVQGKKCTLATDGWTDINGKSVINYILICGEDAYLLETVYTGSISHSASFLAADIKGVFEATTYATIAAVVTDNTATNQLVWQTLQQDYPDIFFHGCISHVIHLIVKDLVARLPWLKKLEDDCRKLVRIFKKNQLLWSELRRLQQLEGKNALVMPADTRWGTIEKCFSSVLESESILHAFVSGRDFPKAKTKEPKAKRRMAFDVVRAKDFVAQLIKAIDLLSVLSRFQEVFERNTRPISDVYKMFLDLPQRFKEMSMPISEFGVITGILRERFDFVYGDAHGVSYLLDPRYVGNAMDHATRESVEEFIAKWPGFGGRDYDRVDEVPGGHATTDAPDQARTGQTDRGPRLLVWRPRLPASAEDHDHCVRVCLLQRCGRTQFFGAQVRPLATAQPPQRAKRREVGVHLLQHEQSSPGRLGAAESGGGTR